MSEFAKKLTEKIYKKINFKPRLKVDIDEKVKFYFSIIGWIITIGCIYYWIHFFIIVRMYEPLVYTTYLSLVLIGFTCLFRFESVLLNSISCITFYGFIHIAIFMISQVIDLFSLIVGPVLHFSIAIFQLFIILHQKIPISKKYLLWSFLFFLIFMSSYDSFQRWDVITGLYDIIPTPFTEVYSFYMLIFSVLGIYLYKKKFGIIVK
jgi:hypothetical protein